MILGSIAPFGFDQFPPEVVLPLVRRAGAVTLQAYRNPDKDISAGEIVTIAGDQGLPLDSMHARHGPTTDISHPDQKHRASAISCLISELDFAAQLGVDMVVVHPSDVDQGNGQARREFFLKSIEQLIGEAAQRNIKLLAENMPPIHSYGSNFRQLIDDIRPFLGDNLGFCFDTGHSNVCTHDVPTNIIFAGQLIESVHVTDNDGKEDQHLLPFSGSIDWQAVSEALHQVGYEGIFCLEAFEPPDQAAEKVRLGLHDKLAALLDRQQGR